VTPPRRRVLRRVATTQEADPRRIATLEKRQAKLAKERVALKRWMSRLRRAFHAVESAQRQIRRMERGLAAERST
jgi:hypothetical protein